MSSSAIGGAANLVSVTSGTERERGFVGIGTFRSDPLKFLIESLNKNVVKLGDML